MRYMMTFLAIFLLFGSLRIVMYVCFYFYFFYLFDFISPVQAASGGGEGLLPDFLFLSSSLCSADHASGIGHVNCVFPLGD